MSYRIGIDVGGTNTDAVVLDEDDEAIAKTKVPTTEDITVGIINALDDVLIEHINREEIDHVMLGTTHCTNAVTERKKLNQVGAVRIGAPATQAIKPLLEWPDDLAAAIGNHSTIIKGGHEFDGEEITHLDEQAIRKFLQDRADKIDTVAITSVFSPVREEHEERAAEIAREVLGEETSVSVSSEIGSIGLLERENATVLNAGLTRVITEASQAFRKAMSEYSIDANFYFGQNDGTLMSVDYAERYPIFTVACGPANSIRGAAYLSGMQDGIIVDIGGTTTDIGAIADGFPRESAVAVAIGGVKTNFRMPDLISIGIGGGSIVHLDEEVTVGPDSVGYELVDRGLIFGGETTTATDVAVASGRAEIGSETPNLDSILVRSADEYIVSEVERAIDEMKTSAGDVSVTIVGGGSILLPPDLAGTSNVHRPDHYDVANAIGAAIAQVSGHIDRVFSLDEQDRERALQRAKEQARDDAIEAGADPETINIVDIEEVPLSYLPGNAIRLKVQAAGELRVSDNA
jgi:N-methylhydantoinase A/oxoprolinase/acetone carboxylase beta subunit